MFLLREIASLPFHEIAAITGASDNAVTRRREARTARTEEVAS